MVDSAPYPSDGENRVPRKHRHEQRSGRSGTRDGNPETQNGYNNGRTQGRNQQERSRSEHHDDRTQSRHHEDRGRSQYQERDKHHEEKEENRNQRERGRDGYRERDKYYEEREHSRNQNRYEERDDRNKERSRNHYPERDDYHKEKNRNHYEERDDDHKERSRDRYDERERPPERYLHSAERQGHPVTSKDPEHYDPSERTFPPNGAQMNDMEYYEPQSEGGILDCHKCRYLCTGRACCQLVEVLLNMLILICCSVSYNSTGGFTGITNLGGIYYYQFGGAYSGFSGADGEKAQTLDVQFYQLKLPTVTASMAFGGALMAFSALLVLVGVLRVPWRWPVWLLVECVLDVAIAVGYMPALYFYFQHLKEAYDSKVCKDREALYSSKGYQGFTCALHGADIAAALFACMAIIVFSMSAMLAIKGFRTVRRMKKKPVNTTEF